MKVRRFPAGGASARPLTTTAPALRPPPPFSFPGAVGRGFRAATASLTHADWRAAGFAALFVTLSAYATNVGYPIPAPHTTGTALIAVALIAILIRYYLPPPRWQRFSLVALAFAVTLGAPTILGPVVGILLLLQGALFAPAAEPRAASHARLFRSASLTLSLFAVYLLLEASGLLYPDLSVLCWTLGAKFTGIQGQPVQLGPYQSGAGWIVLGFLTWLSPLLLRPLRGRTWLLAALTLPLLVGGVAWGLWHRQALTLVATIGLLAACQTLFAGDEREDELNRPRRFAFRMAAGAACLAGGAALLFWGCFGASASPTERQAGAVAIVEGGLKSLNIASGKEIKLSDGADFGALLPLCDSYGIPARTLPVNFAPDALRDVGVLLIINPTREFTPEQREGMRRYVAAGGSLLVLGDHTDIDGILKPLNGLLSFTGIRFENDSAIPMDAHTRWVHALRGAWHPAFIGGDNSRFGISVGASLACDGRARVLVVGDRAFSDAARPWFGISHLGNMSYDLGERMGGLPLVAEEVYGRGVVQVWGDTSGFQDTQLTRTHAQVAQTLQTLRNRQPSGIARGPLVALAGGGMAAGVLLLLPSAVLTAAAWLVTGLLVAGGSRFATHLPAPTRLEKVAVLDGGHGSLYPQLDPNLDIHTFSETFLRAGLSLQQHGAGRPGDLTRLLDLPTAQRPRAVVLLAPTRPYTEREAALLRRYVEEGGELMAFGGYPERNALLPVLQRFRLDISAEPFGAAHNARFGVAKWRSALMKEGGSAAQRGALKEATEQQNKTGASRDRAQDVPRKTPVSRPVPRSIEDEMRAGQVSAYDAEIAMIESYPVIAPPDTVPLITCWGRPVAVRRTVGKGRITLIGDARFATGKSLGWKDPLNARSIRFLLFCLEP